MIPRDHHAALLAAAEELAVRADGAVSTAQTALVEATAVQVSTGRLLDVLRSLPVEPPPAPLVPPLERARGVWALRQFDSPAAVEAGLADVRAALALDCVHGLSVRFPWHAVPGGDFTIAEPLCEAAREAGKPIALRWLAGRYTPADWMGHAYPLARRRIGRGDELAPAPFGPDGAPNRVFLAAWGAQARAHVAWALEHDSPIAFLPWPGAHWGEFNHGADVQAAPGYSGQAWLDGHVIPALAGCDLAADTGGRVAVGYAGSGHPGPKGAPSIGDVFDVIADVHGDHTPLACGTSNGLGVHNGRAGQRVTWGAQAYGRNMPGTYSDHFAAASAMGAAFVELYLEDLLGDRADEVCAAAGAWVPAPVTA